MDRSYYNSTFNDFLDNDNEKILGIISTKSGFDDTTQQKIAWREQIIFLKSLIENLDDGYISFEFEIPRMGKRIDNIIMINGIIFIIEFKIGGDKFKKTDMTQVEDYALDLKNYHKDSHDKIIVPILLITKNSEDNIKNYTKAYDDVYEQINATKNNILKIINFILDKEEKKDVNYFDWEKSPYKPTRNIIESAKESYSKHGVKNIKSSIADRENLQKTRNSILKIVNDSKKNKKKSICFITGVPGSGKTLAGLDIIQDLTSEDDRDIRSCYISGNGPLVSVLTEALARDKIKQNIKIKKGDAKDDVKQFIQQIRLFVNEYKDKERLPDEKVIIFDEAQRCWDQNGFSKALKKEGIVSDQSQAEFLISVMDRHNDWSTIICLIGGGQEINHDEGGVLEWFKAITLKFNHWDLYYPKKILTMAEYNWDNKLNAIIDKNPKFIETNDLHLDVSFRSFRSENVSKFIEHLLNIEPDQALQIYNDIKNKYPLVLTRNINSAKKWVIEQRRGSERMGLFASAGGKRLFPAGVSVYTTKPSDVKHYFLNDDNDVRSSNFLENAATEFDIQGLELDWSIVSWDYDFSIQNGSWKYMNFVGKKWNNIHKPEKKLYNKNAYRVLLTRARQGMVLFVPEGDNSDYSRQKTFYDGTYNYLKSIGIKEIV